MKKYSIIAILFLMGCSACKKKEPEPEVKPETGMDVTVKFNSMFADSAISWTKYYLTGSGDTILFDKVKFLMSDFTLEKSTGELLVLKDAYAYISLKAGRDSVILKNVPKGDYTSIRFKVGLDSAINHGDPTQYQFTDPLSPALNEMHWGWAGGYIFNIIEGYFKNNGATAAFSFHIATLKNARIYSFVEDFKISKNSKFTFDVKMDKYFDNIDKFSLKTDGSFSHSGDVDAVMDKFIVNVNGVLEYKKFE